MNKKKLLALLMALVMTLTLVPVTALAEVDPTTGYNGAKLPVGPDMSGSTINVTANNAQYVLDGAYGDINGKTINFTENIDDVLELALPTKYAGSGTTVDGSRYTRVLSNITFTANDNITLAGFRFRAGHVYGKENAPEYDYYLDRYVYSTNDSHYRIISLNGITFKDLTINGKVDLNLYQAGSTVSNITFDGCDIASGNMTSAPAINLRADNQYYSNVIVKNCNLHDSFQGLYIQGIDGLQILNNKVVNTTHNAFGLQSSTSNDAKGTIIVKENYVSECGNRAVRFNYIDSTANITINDNVFLKTADATTEEADVIKDALGANTATVNLDNNYWNGAEAQYAVQGTFTAPTAVGLISGTFPVNVSAYCAEGYTATESNGVWTVGPAAATNYVAQIGTTNYETLEAAFAAAQDGETITLLANCAGNGIKAPQGKFGTNGLTVNFNGHTYTVDGDTVGSTGTETNGFQLLKDNTITFKNGTITSAKAKILVQNYSNLTLEGMTLTLNNPNYTGAYTLSNNNGNVVIDGSTIDANPAGGFAFDVCRYSSYPSVNVTVTGNSTINGNVEISASGSDAKEGFGLTLTSGTMTGNIIMDATAAAAMDATPEKVTITKASGFDKAAPDGYKWDNDGNLVKVTYVAQIGEAKYETLEAAITDANPGETIGLLTNVTVDLGSDSTSRLAISKSMTIDGDGHTISINDRGFGVGMGASSNIDVTFKDVTIENSSSGARCIDTRGNLNSLTLNNVTLSTDHGGGQYTQPLTIGGSQTDTATINITNSTIQTNDDATAYYAIITFNPVNMTITDSTIKGWACIYAKAASSSAGSHDSKFTISGSKLYSNNVYGGDSNHFTAIMIEDKDVAVDITNTTIDIETTKGSYQGIIGFKQNGDTAGSVVNLGNGNIVTLSGDKALISFASGNNPDPKYQNYGKIAVSGGIFNREIYDILCADGYAPIGNTDPATKEAYPYTVGKIQVTDYETATITTDQSSSVDNDALADVVSDTDVQTTIRNSTKVSGVQLTNNLTVEDNATNGVQAVVDEAMKKSEFSDAMDTASKVEIEVDVKVTPKTFSEEAVTFKLTPVATVKTYASETADTPTSTVTGIAVENDWIDQSQPITVQLYTNFLPSQIIHRDNDGNVIEVFTGNQIVYDATTGVATVTISHFSELEAVQYVAQIGDNKYATLKAAFDAAGNNDTIKLLADISLTERLFVNAGATPAYAGANNRYATTSENKSITLDMNGHNIDSSSNIALAGGSLTITGTGKISTSASGLAPIEIRGTGDLTSKRTLTIDSGVTLDGEEYGLNVFGSNNAQKNLIDVTVHGTVNGTLFVLGNLTNTENAINIVVDGKVSGGDHVGIALNGYGNVTVNNGADISGTTGIEVRAGKLTVTGGKITGTASTYTSASNSSGSATSGAGIAVAQHTTGLPITTTLIGGTVSAVDPTKVVAVDSVEAGTDMADITVTAESSFVQNQNVIPDGYEWKKIDTDIYRVVEKPVKVLGGSLRRRATNGGNGNIVYNETDLRFGFTVTDAGHFSTEKSYFTYSFGDYTSGHITATKIANDGTTNLVLTKVPANYFSTKITVTLHAFDKSGEPIGTATLTKSVKEVAFALQNGENIDIAWKTYAGTIISENNLQN